MRTELLKKKEESRLNEVLQYHILDSSPEPDFDDLTSLITSICNTPISAFTIVDKNRVWYKSKIGFSSLESPRDLSFCTHTILQNDLFIVQDTLLDDRTFVKSLAISNPTIRFYAGAPIFSKRGFALGAFCVMDQIPRELTSIQTDALRIFARQISKLLDYQYLRSVLIKDIIHRINNLSTVINGSAQHLDELDLNDLKNKNILFSFSNKIQSATQRICKNIQELSRFIEN